MLALALRSAILRAMRTPRCTLILSVLLAACSAVQSGPDPQELLERVAAKQQESSSANFGFSLTLSSAGTGVPDASFEGTGSMQEFGRLIGLTGTLETKISGTPMEIEGQLVLIGGQETYIRVDDVAVNAGIATVSVDAPALQGFLDRWWLLPMGQTRRTDVGTMDPGLLALQSRIWSVTADRGSATVDGKTLRTLDVAIDQRRLKEYLTLVSEQRGADAAVADVDSLLNAYDIRGTVIIDQDALLLTSIEWNMTSRSDDQPSVSLRVLLRDHGAGSPVVKPVGALPFVPGITPITLFTDAVPSLQKAPASADLSSASSAPASAPSVE